MQIHELNNFTGTLGAGAYLAIDDGNDTGKISSQGLLAATEARIDNIIAGPAPSAEEIVDARLGDDGVTYPSLGDAIRDQFSDVKSDFSNYQKYVVGAENLFDGIAWTEGWYINSSGVMSPIAGFHYSGEIDVEDGDYYIYVHSTDSGKTIRIVGYDNGVFDSVVREITSTSGDSTYKITVSGIDGIRISCSENLSVSAIAKTGKIADEVLTLKTFAETNRASGIVVGAKDSFNNAGWTEGWYINSSGVMSPILGFHYSDEFAVSDGEYYLYVNSTDSNKVIRVVGYYNNVFSSIIAEIDSVVGESVYKIVVKGANGIRISCSQNCSVLAVSNLNSMANLQTLIDSLESVDIILPSALYVAVGRQITLYKENAIRCNNPNNFVLDWYTDISNTEFDESIRFTPTVSDIGTHTLMVDVYNAKNKTLITSKTIPLEVVADTSRSSKKVIFIGDSLTNAGFYPYEIQKHLSNEGVESIGTITTTAYLDSDPSVTTMVSVNHEGRGGWSAKDYVTKASKGDVVNAFWNSDTSKFDFSYYMTQQGYSDIDAVCVSLGTNGTSDINAEISAITEIINSIRTYDADMPIVVSAIPCGNVTENRYIDMYLTEIRMLQLANFDNADSGIYIAPIYLNLNRYTDFVTEEVSESARNPEIVIRQINSVHPRRYGYFKFADVYWSVLQAIFG